LLDLAQRLRPGGRRRGGVLLLVQLIDAGGRRPRTTRGSRGREIVFLRRHALPFQPATRAAEFPLEGGVYVRRSPTAYCGVVRRFDAPFPNTSTPSISSRFG